MNINIFAITIIFLAISISCEKVLAKPDRQDHQSSCTAIIKNPWIRAAPPGVPSLAGYVTIANPCKTPITIVGVESLDFAMPMIHQSVVENGISKMRDAGKLVIGPNDQLLFQPGGLHLMLMKPRRQFQEGDKARIRFVLEDGRRFYAEYPILRTAPVSLK